MDTHPGRFLRIGLASAIALLLFGASGAYADAPVRAQGTAVEVAQAGGTEPRELEPRYKPVEPEEPSWYNSSYIFGMTRSVAGSTMVPAAKVPLFVLTVPLDIVFLPFAAIGGLFG